MRILIISTTFPPHMSGVATATANLGHQLAKKHPVSIISSSTTKQPQTKHLSPQLTLNLLPSINLGKKAQLAIAYPQPKKVEAIINHFQPHIIHLQDFGPICLSALNIGSQLNIPIVITHHFTAAYVFESLIPAKKLSHRLSQNTVTKQLIYRLVNLIYNRCDLVTVPNPSLIPYFHQAKLTTPIISVSNGIAVKNFTYKSRLKSILNKYNISGSKIILFVGRLDPDKNLNLLINAFKPISQHNPDVSLVFVGKGRQKRKLIKLVQKLNLNNSVYFLGKINNQKRTLSHLYNAAYLFANPSIIENQSVAFIEALAAGLPIVASNLSSQTSFIEPNQNGLLFEPNNPIALAVCLQKLLNNPRLRKRISANNQKKAKQFDIAITNQQYLKAYQSLLN